jgi:hypothetical protein
MFARFKLKSCQLGPVVPGVLIALLAMLAGCDKKPRWRGVGTDKSAEHSPEQQASERNVSIVKPR